MHCRDLSKPHCRCCCILEKEKNEKEVNYKKRKTKTGALIKKWNPNEDLGRRGPN
jgi:hypothetical protein